VNDDSRISGTSKYFIFFQIVVLSYLVAAVLSIFPAKMSTAQDSEIVQTKGQTPVLESSAK
jgi:ABC-type Na+ efflux pump permease subunit